MMRRPSPQPSQAGSAEVRVLTAERGIFDFNVVPNFARDYLSTYYCQAPTQDEQAVIAFLASHYRRIPATSWAIEIGCGPTVHHVLPLAPYVSEIHMADYLPENLEQVRLWRDRAPGAHEWQDYTALTLALEGREATPAAVARREAETRAKISRFRHCDLKMDSPLETSDVYPVVACFYCVENIGVTTAEWTRVMRRVAALTAPGGYLFLSALNQTEFYVVRSADGRLNRLPAAYLTEDDFRQILPTLGFDAGATIVESRSFTGQEREGVNGVVLVAARKA